MSTSEIIGLARLHSYDCTNASSARVCLTEALHNYDCGNYFLARERALRSLLYSVGAYGKPYKRALAAHSALTARQYGASGPR